MLRSDDLAAAARVIENASSLAMACHVGPDGDAIGSMLALAVAAADHGKAVFASFGQPFSLPATYRYLPVDLMVPPAEVPGEPEVMVTFDAGSIDRLGDLAANAAMAAHLIVIDHHASNTGFGNHNLIDPAAAATAEIVLDLMDVLGWEVDETVATCLHTGLVTDTGRFQYSNTMPRTLEMASRLVAAGAQPEEIGRHVYEETPFGYLKVAGAVLSRARLDPERRIVWSVLTEADLDEAGVTLDDTDPLIDALRTPIESDVALLVKELDDGRVKASLRSRGRVDVSAIAVDMGGGGHHNAAGFTFRGTTEDVVAAVLARLERVDA